jgi:hypothetical protein
VIFIGLRLASRISGVPEHRLVRLAERGKIPCWHMSDGLLGFMVEDLRELHTATPPTPPEPVRYPAAPALVVIEQLALEYPPDGTQTHATGHSTAVVVLARRSGLDERTWERRIARWRATGYLSRDDADRLASSAHRHLDELWGRQGVA